MSYETTLGWSLLSSGIVTLLVGFLPGGDWLWGIILCLLGGGVLYARRGSRRF